jgi:HAE1 family hydrophobic/amphiphilic exporter-1
MHALISLAVKRPITTLMFFLGIIIFGVIAASDLSIEFLPEIEVPRLVVTASYPGLPPSEMKELITIPVEDGLSSLKGIRNIMSVSREGLSTIELEFHWGTDMKMAAVETREAIDLVFTTLPADAKKPMVLPINPGEEPVIWIGVFPLKGDITLARRLAEREIKTRLQQVEGVGSIVVIGGTTQEMQILVDHEKCAGRGLTIEALAQVLSRSNFDFPAGSFTEGETEFLVKSEGRVQNAEELGELFVGKNQQGQGIKLKEVASVALGQKEKTSFFQWDDKEGVALLIRRKAGVSPLKLSENVKRELSNIERSYGKDLELIMAKDTSGIVSVAINELFISALLGMGIAFFVILFFLRRFTTSLILISAVPISVLASLLLIRLSGGSLNTMSLGGLAMGIGMLVDNSVVVLENLERKAAPPLMCTADAIISATSEMAASTFGSTITTLVVFIPVIFLPGIVGALFKDLALAVCYSIGLSFFVSVTIVPVLYFLSHQNRFIREHLKPEKIPKFLFLHRTYRFFFRFFLRRPLLLLAVVAGLFILGFLVLPLLAVEFMPDVDSGEIEVTAVLPPGTSLDYLQKVNSTLSSQAKRITDVDHTFSRAGGQEDDPYFLADPQENSEKLHMQVQLKNNRSHSLYSLVEALSTLLEIKNAEIIISLPENIITPLLGIKGNEIVLSASGENQEQALAIAEEVKSRLNDPELFKSVNVIPVLNKPELHMYPDRESLANSGFSLMQVATAVRSYLDGMYPSKITIEGREIDIRIRLREEDRTNMELVQQLSLLNQNGGRLAVNKVAELKLEKGYGSLLRINRKDVAYVQAGLSRVNQVKTQKILSEIIASSPEVESQSSSALEQNLPRILLTFVLALLLLYLVLGAQFQSFVLPLLLMLALPLSFSGVILALFAYGKSINLSSCLGMLVLLGVVVNNSIILFENYRMKIEQGMSLTLVVYRGSVERLKPILITVLTTVTALIPISIDPYQHSTQSPMAVAVIGGLSISTALTLFVIPLVFLIYYRRKKK